MNVFRADDDRTAKYADFSGFVLLSRRSRVNFPVAAHLGLGYGTNDSKKNYSGPFSRRSFHGVIES